MRSEQGDPEVWQADVERIVTYEASETEEGEQSGGDDDDGDDDNDSIRTPTFKRQRLRDVYLQSWLI